MRRAAVIVGAVLVVALPQLAQARPAAKPKMTILAASSLTEVFPRIDRRAAYSFAGSNQLALQIEQGAPADLFASASPAYTQGLYRKRLVERPRTFASNALVLAVPQSNPAGLGSVFDLRGRNVKLVIGTAAVPIGAYTRQVLRKLGLSEADGGFVYRIDVRAAGGRLKAIRIPARGQPEVRYEIAVMRSSRHKAAARGWIRTFTRTARTRLLLRRAGFIVR
jgi:molybdate transport system substrate-binding protein